MSKQSLSIAKELFYGKGAYGRAHQGRRGIPVGLITRVSFGAVANGSSNAICTSQSLNASTDANINGALASGGVATLPVARNVVAGWTTTAVITITGYDEYGELVVEQSASGTSFTGKKAFKRIIRVRTSANVTGLTVGTGNVLGLPYRVDANGLLLGKLANATDAGTFVPADTTEPATATTGDVRGTYAPNGTLNGSNVLDVFFHVSDPSTKKGAYGVAQFGG